MIGPDETAPVGICFMPVPETKTLKNQVHLDLTSEACDRDSEIERLLELGARSVEIGQTGNESWIAFADPERNEFCVVPPKSTLIRSPSAPMVHSDSAVRARPRKARVPHRRFRVQHETRAITPAHAYAKAPSG